jgi:C-terminal processing protease CtpA/Prc
MTTLSQSDRTAVLEGIDRLVREKFYDAQFNGRNWGAIVQESRSAIVGAASVEEFEAAVGSMLSKLGSSGLGLLGSGTKITPRNAINASFARVDATAEGLRWVFQDVLPGGVAARAGICSGDILISVLGKEILPPEMPAFAMGGSVNVVVSKRDKRSEVKLDLQTPRPKHRDNPYAEPKSVSAALRDGVGQLKVSLFPGLIGIDFANRLKAVVENELSGAERLVVDLRGNPGGGVGALRLMSVLTAGSSPVGYSLDRATAERGVDRDSLPRFGKIPASKMAIPVLAWKFMRKKSVVLQTEGLGARRFHGRVVVLINEHSTGAAEMVAQFVKENSLATIVGTKTPGRLVAREAFKVASGYRVTIPVGAYVSWKGTRIEGRGIDPDVLVPWSYEDAREGGDNQLAAATKVVQGM